MSPILGAAFGFVFNGFQSVVNGVEKFVAEAAAFVLVPAGGFAHLFFGRIKKSQLHGVRAPLQFQANLVHRQCANHK